MTVIRTRGVEDNDDEHTNESGHEKTDKDIERLLQPPMSDFYRLFLRLRKQLVFHNINKNEILKPVFFRIRDLQLARPAGTLHFGNCSISNWAPSEGGSSYSRLLSCR